MAVEVHEGARHGSMMRAARQGDNRAPGRRRSTPVGIGHMEVPCKPGRPWFSERGMAVPQLFTAEQVSRLTGLSRDQLRYWDETGFFLQSSSCQSTVRRIRVRSVVSTPSETSSPASLDETAQEGFAAAPSTAQGLVARQSPDHSCPRTSASPWSSRASTKVDSSPTPSRVSSRRARRPTRSSWSTTGRTTTPPTSRAGIRRCAASVRSVAVSRRRGTPASRRAQATPSSSSTPTTGCCRTRW